MLLSEGSTDNFVILMIVSCCSYATQDIWLHTWMVTVLIKKCVYGTSDGGYLGGIVIGSMSARKLNNTSHNIACGDELFNCRLFLDYFLCSRAYGSWWHWISDCWHWCFMRWRAKPNLALFYLSYWLRNTLLITYFNHSRHKNELCSDF